MIIKSNVYISHSSFVHELNVSSFLYMVYVPGR